jgi:hypothetical protein
VIVRSPRKWRSWETDPNGQLVNHGLASKSSDGLGAWRQLVASFLPVAFGGCPVEALDRLSHLLLVGGCATTYEAGNEQAGDEDKVLCGDAALTGKGFTFGD